MTRKPFRFSVMAHGLPLLAACFMLFTVKELMSKPAKDPQMPSYAPVTAPYDTRVAGIGVVEPQSELLQLGTHLDGIIDIVHVKVGDKVKKGASLFTLDTRETRSRLASARAAEEQARVSLADARSQLGFYEKIADPAAVSREELARRRFAAQRASALAKEAAARVKEVETELARHTVHAPVDGEILRLNARPGEYAKTGILTEPLVTMGDISTLHVRVEVDEADAQRVKSGMPAKGALRSAGDKTVDLAFVRFEPLLQPKGSLTGAANERVDTRVLEIIYALESNAINAYPGQQMDVFIEVVNAQ